MANGNGHDRPRDPEGRFVEGSFKAVYDALSREVHRIDDLRTADQTAAAAALAAADRAGTTALAAAKEAVNKAEAAQQRTNEGQNEFRAQLKDQAATFLTRNEYELSSRAFAEKIGSIDRQQTEQRGRIAGTTATWGTVIAIGTTAAVIGGAIAGAIVNFIK